MNEEITYYSDRENAYRSVRFCLSDEILVEISKEMETDLDIEIDQIAKIALEEYMCKKGYLRYKEE